MADSVAPQPDPPAPPRPPTTSKKDLKINTNFFIIATLSPPVVAIIGAFVVGFWLDYSELVNYEWTCGTAFLPSVSRIINLPKERILWHLGGLGHLSFRPLMILYHYNVAHSVILHRPNSPLLRLGSLVLLASGTVEIAFVAALTTVGERENGNIHMAFFIVFITACNIHFLLITIFTRLKNDFSKNPRRQRSFKLKLFFLACNMLFVPLITVFFTLYWTFCFQIAYNFFASFEYLTLGSILGFHASTIVDLGGYVFVVSNQRPRPSQNSPGSPQTAIELTG